MPSLSWTRGLVFFSSTFFVLLRNVVDLRYDEKQGVGLCLVYMGTFCSTVGGAMTQGLWLAR